MSHRTAVLLTLIVYKLVLIAIGLWAHKRTRDNEDFYLGGRGLGPVVAAISASASSSSAWTLVGVSGAAYLWGLSAVWLFPATVGGFMINWLWVAPRLMRLSRAENTVTVSEVIAGPRTDRLFPVILWVCSFIVCFSFVFYVASQFQAAGNAFEANFDLDGRTSLLIGAAIVLIYTLLGGFWAVSVTDTLQGLLMAATGVFLPVVALTAVGGFGELWSGLLAAGGPQAVDWFGGRSAPMAAGFAIGLLGIGLGYPGQPHVVNRFMALKDERALRHGRVIALAWAVLIYAGMLLVGWCGRVLVARIPDDETILFAVANLLLPGLLAGILVAAVLSAIMSTADSQLLVAGSSVSYDLQIARGEAPAGGHSLWISRIVVLFISAVAILTALFLPDKIFSRVLFAWHAVGSAFGPVLLVRLAGWRLDARFVLAALVAGFVGTVVLNSLPDPLGGGDLLERFVPFTAALILVWLGRRQRFTF